YNSSIVAYPPLFRSEPLRRDSGGPVLAPASGELEAPEVEDGLRCLGGPAAPGSLQAQLAGCAVERLHRAGADLESPSTVVAVVQDRKSTRLNSNHVK